MDDVTIMKVTLEEQYAIHRVLRRMTEFRLELNLKKCHFCYQEIEFLGYHISKNGIRTTNKHLQAIKDFPVPTNSREVQQSLGLFSYFRRFIPSFSRIAKPLLDLLRKDSAFCFSSECKNAFQHLKT